MIVEMNTRLTVCSNVYLSASMLELVRLKAQNLVFTTGFFSCLNMKKKRYLNSFHIESTCMQAGAEKIAQSKHL